ncbi:glycoside hydrolase family 66 protein [Chloroflexota bacterium]
MTRRVWTIVIAFFIFLCVGSPSAGAEVPSSLELIIPEYVVTAIGNLDYVEIPEGEILIAEEGRPRVPYYIKSIDYPKGYRVQDVILKERAGLATATGLRLPVVILSQYPKLPIEMKKGWYPEEEYSWRLWENLDGSTTLVIKLYPFYYNPETTDVKFYRNYLFNIEYILSSKTITALYTDKDFYKPGDKVAVEMRLKNSGEAQNVIVSTIIKQYGSDETVDSLPLRTLKDLAGDASLTVEWDSSGTEEGYYYVEVNLSDAAGNTLNKKTAAVLIEDSESLPKPAPETPPSTPQKPIKFPTLYMIIGAIVIMAMVALFVVRRLRKKT